MINNIVFDFGKVLVDYDFDSFIRDIFHNDTEEASRFQKVVYERSFVDRCDKGEEPVADILHETQDKYPEWRVQFQEFHDRQLDVVTGEIPGMRQLIARLRSESYRLYGLTNWSSFVYPVIDKFDILRLLDDRLISSEEKLLKPDTAIYLRLCDKFGLKPEECVFTDDRPDNVEGARKAGMSAILFKDATSFEKELYKLLDSH